MKKQDEESQQFRSSENSKYHLGLDIGSISVNAVLIDDDKNILANRYEYCYGKPFDVLLRVLDEIVLEYGFETIGSIAFTGSGGKQAAELTGGVFVNEIIAQASSVGELYPHIRTIIEMGGEDSKLIFMENGTTTDYSRLSDFSMNSLCAAGTGSFLDQQASRIEVPIIKKFGELALMSENPPRIAGRCSVFAKSDMIHLQQIATPLHDIVAGLCFAVARNFKSTLGRGKKFEKPFIFQGGVAANIGMVRAFREIFELEESELLIPEYHASMGALGAILHTLKNQNGQVSPFKGIEELNNYLTSDRNNTARLEILTLSKAEYNITVKEIPKDGAKTEVFLGVDVGSLSTNVVLIDSENNVVARRYLPTASKPLNAIQRGLKEIYEEIGEHVSVIGAGATGSGRYLTGDFIGADTIQNEITAQATAAIAYDPTVDTIFEIGGQDSKYISIENGVVVDFEMNKVCAAGTGSFLEEQADKLNISIVGQFAGLAFKSEKPVRLGDRCTVFMESDLNSHQQKGADIADLVGGLAYSIVQNYIHKVVGDKPVGKKIFFQGGVTNNKAVVAAFEKITGKSIIIPPHFDVTGAIGAAILARNSMAEGQKTRFKGFNISKIPFAISSFTCHACTNDCEIQQIKIEGESKKLFYGGRCEKYELDERKGKGKDIPNLFEERLGMLMGDFREEPENGKITIGIPRALTLFYQQFPFWRTFFEQLGFRIVLSEPSNQQIVTRSIELMVSETCLPVELMHGHVENLLSKKVDYIFQPFIVNAKGKKDNPTNNCNCPWIQSYPFIVRSAFTDTKIRRLFLTPTLHFRYFERVLKKELSAFMKEKFDIPVLKTKRVIDIADAAQMRFEDAVFQRGKEVMANLPKDKKALVILGRQYNTTDPLLNLRLVEKLINLDTLPIPVDFLPLFEENIFDDYKMMYWPSGQKILSASRIVRKNDNLYAVYMGNFRCGPDSFLTHFVRREMKGKPYLHIEVDEHSADAGLITRCEAFLDSLAGYQKVKGVKTEIEKPKVIHSKNLDGRTLYLPYAGDTVYMIAAAARSCGIDAKVLPMQDTADLEIARKHTSGQECFPAICTTGNFLKKLMEPGIDPKKVSFFMPNHNGPCRFGDYNKLHRIIFDKLGFDDVHLMTPSNDNAYADLAGKDSKTFRKNAWSGIVGLDLLRRLLQERRPYELVKGESDKVYLKYRTELENAVTDGAKNVGSVLERAGKAFHAVEANLGKRKPVIAVVGEIFMRDNPFCSGHLIERLEALGAETIISPFGEWLHYSSYRYWRDSVWKGDLKGLFKSKVQQVYQHYVAKKLSGKVSGYLTMRKELEIDEILKLCSPYIHKDYDGDPPIALGSAAGLVETDISGVANILPFTCMPGTIICAVSNDFKKDHHNIPWLNYAYDGQEDSSNETRLQAFMHQAKEYSAINEFDKPANWYKETKITG
ncbi:MAG: CoA-substrate-specific enzyme [Prolixibacteraceae bacterium]|nr:MAG: CoA-substrate-specific enzyme [Prolixibacteraceae bacterium]